MRFGHPQPERGILGVRSLQAILIEPGCIIAYAALHARPREGNWIARAAANLKLVNAPYGGFIPAGFSAKAVQQLVILACVMGIRKDFHAVIHHAAEHGKRQNDETPPVGVVVVDHLINEDRLQNDRKRGGTDHQESAASAP
jgi:hypothetical protein